jgi:flavin-dependent dehydrogenase
MTAKFVGRQAVVVGAGMGGLAAAGALADYFEQVVVFERDALPSQAAHRAGTPQSRHLHALLAGGLRALEELFPGFEQNLARAGAVSLRVAIDTRMELPGFNPFPERDLGWNVYSMSRPLLERVVRQCLQEYSRIAPLEGCRVRELVVSADHTAVTAVNYENADGSSETLPADLVVDASGRGILTLNLLKTIGRPQPEETLIGVDLGYATAIFAIPDDAPSDWKAVLTLAQAPESSKAALWTHSAHHRIRSVLATIPHQQNILDPSVGSAIHIGMYKLMHPPLV